MIFEENKRLSLIGLKYLGNPGELPILTNQRFSYSPSGDGIRQQMHFVSHALRRDTAMNAAFVHRLEAGCERKELRFKLYTMKVAGELQHPCKTDL